MALVHAYSTAITNADATPVVRATSGLLGRGALTVEETVITPAGQADILSTYSLFRIPSNAKVKRVVVQGGDQGTTGAWDVGAYYGPDNAANYVSPPTVAGASVIDKDFFVAALDANSANGSYADVVPGGGWKVINATISQLAGAGGWTAAKANKELWDALGLTSDPKCQIDIIASAQAAFDVGTAPAYFRIEYVL